MGGAPAGGRLTGGLLIRADLAGQGWRAIFLVNLPIAAAALAMVPRPLPESRSERPAPLDGVGIALLGAGSVGVLLPLVQGREQGWPAWTWMSLALGVVLLGALLAHARALGRRGGAPL